MTKEEQPKEPRLTAEQEKALREFSALMMIGSIKDAAKAWKRLIVTSYSTKTRKAGDLEDGLEFEIELVNILLLDQPPRECVQKVHEYVTAKGLGSDFSDAIKKQKTLMILTHDEFIDRDFFDYFFAFRLSKKPLKRVYDFLKYHLDYSFRSDVKRYSNYLMYSIILGQRALLDNDRIQIIESFRDDYGSRKPERPLSTRQAAIVLYIKIQTKETLVTTTKTKLLRSYSKEIGKGQVSFLRVFYEVENDFKNRHSKLRAELGKLLPLLTGDSKKWVEQHQALSTT